MAIQITQAQYNTTRQTVRNYQVKINLLDFDLNILDSLEGNVISGNVAIDANSDIRRTCQLSLVVTDSSFDVQAGGQIFLDKLFQVYVGVQDFVSGEIAWTNMGVYIINQPSYTTNIASMCVDLGRDVTFSALTMSFLADRTVASYNTSAFFDLRTADGTHNYKTLTSFVNENGDNFKANVENSGRFRLKANNTTFRYVYVYYMSASYSMVQTDSISDFQVEFGESFTSFEETESTKVSVPLGRTIYGGSVDLISGLLSVEYVSFELDTLTWQGGNVGGTYCWNTNMSGNNLKIPENGSIFDGVCDTYTPIRFNGVSANVNTIALRNNGVLYVNNNSTSISPTGHVTIALATPLIIQLSQREIQTLYGDNTIWNDADAGDTSVTYRRDIELALQSGPALMMMARPPLMQQSEDNAEEANEPEETEDDSN